MIVVIQWLLRGNNGIVVLGLICAVVGACYSAPDLFGRRALFLMELTQCLITGTLSGLALGIGITLTAVPVILLFRKSLYASKIPGGDIVVFVQAMLAPVTVSLLLMIVKQVFIYSVILGIIMGCGFGLVNTLLSLLRPPQRSKNPVVANNVAQSAHSKDVLIGWMIVGVGFGAGLWLMLGSVMGLVFGLLVGGISFLLGLHPKPAPLQNPSTYNTWVRFGRIVGFWFLCVSMTAVILLWLFVYYILPEPVLGSFLLLVLLLFFGYLFRELQGLESRKTKVRVVSSQTNLHQATLAVDRLKVLRSIRTGVVSGLLLYGCAYGIPIAFIFWRIVGTGAAAVAFTMFCLLGLGFGASYGIVFCYIYNFKYFVTLKITSLPEKTLRFVGLILTIVGIFISILPSFVW